MMHCGFIGLGNIGKPMAENLAKKCATYDMALTVFDVMPAPMADLAALGASTANSPEDMAKQCELIGICVRNDDDVEQLLYGANGRDGMLKLGRPNAIFAIHSTVTRDNIVRWAADAKQHNIHVVDAPITGGAGGAAAGTLCIMLGASPELSERLQPMLSCMASKLVAAGEPGAGTVLKLANNLMNYTAFTAISEATALVKAAGVDVEKLFEVGEANGVITPMAKQFVTGRDGLFSGCTKDEMFSIFGPFAGLAEKDLDHALHLAAQLGLEFSVAKKVREGIHQTFLEVITAKS
ncbi:NAD(P)-dependent oxidoreductase [uncultured Zhongshania sp.]|jgi:3-hydroxyisobutyrate dehydrogenase|uniref:NAD(P)-dependent oxidoreductase n=1 Tax=uncultured Zhongshania sp. TaxID=1642288 RepID=UPI0025D2B110|nr:NAD(P)-dependent oxidoreductase [uncultured Zhongshania sp.]